MSVLDLRRNLDTIVGPMRRKQFFNWLTSGSSSKYLMYVQDEKEADRVSKLLCEVGIPSGFYPTESYPNQYTVWIQA